MAVSYGMTSPYKNTPLFAGKFLDIMVPRELPKMPDDILFTVSKTYEYRPDKLAFDLYNDPNLWWVFAIRNKNSIVDPIWDFVTGTRIYLPQKSTVQRVLGY
jgi:hypothetical protein